MGRRVSSAGKLIGGVFAVAGLVRVGKAVGKVGASYVDSLNKIQALTGSTDRQMGKLADPGRVPVGAFAKYGQTTGDAAAGHGRADQVRALGPEGARCDPRHHAAGQGRRARGRRRLDPGGEHPQHLRPEGVEGRKIANSLANAANISSADVSDLAESFKYVCAARGQGRVSVDQTNAILAELANSGIKASQAGTTCAGSCSPCRRRRRPAECGSQLGVKVYGAGGKMRDFGSILEDLRTGGLAKVSDEDANFALKSIFGRNGDHRRLGADQGRHRRLSISTPRA
jgi:hypothetical protein